MSTLTDIFKKFEESMSAATFAEAGEFETARQFLAANKNARKRVLLGTDKPEIDARIINNAIQLCQRLGGGLEVFHVLRTPEEDSALTPAQGKGRLAAVNSALLRKGITYQPLRSSDCLADEVLRHADRRRDILCVVFDAMETSGATCRKAKDSMLAKFKALHCPVVMYSQSAKT